MKPLNQLEIGVIILFILFLAAGWVFLDSFVTGAAPINCEDFLRKDCYPPAAHYP